MHVGGFCVNHPQLIAVPGSKIPLCKLCVAGNTSKPAVIRTEQKSNVVVIPSAPAELSMNDLRARLASAKEAQAKKFNPAIRKMNSPQNKSEPKPSRELPKAFHNWKDPGSSAENSQACADCGVEKRKHGYVKCAEEVFQSDTICAPLTDKETMPILILFRGATKNEVIAAFQKLVDNVKLLRKVSVDYLPRAKRRPHDENRAKVPDPICGFFKMDLDDLPWALWIPLDYSVTVSDDTAKYETAIVKQVCSDKWIEMIPANPPPDYANPSRWTEKDMTGAEVLDLRNYPKVYKARKDHAIASLEESAGWFEALRDAVNARNGKAIWETLHERNPFRYQLRDRLNPPKVAMQVRKSAPVQVWDNPQVWSDPRTVS